MTASPIFQHSLRPPCVRHTDRGECNRYHVECTETIQTIYVRGPHWRMQSCLHLAIC